MFFSLFFFLFSVLTVLTRAGGEYQEVNGYKSCSPGQPFTTDPKWAAQTKEWMKFQKMNNISWMQDTGEFRSGKQ
tara:strand:+ start:364 stop:588 length:225 start_codon:yes stop_codon:yes gene_type:complete